jgi:hypothetical protein
VTEGNRPVWLTDSGMLCDCVVATELSGTLPAVDELHVDVLQPFGGLPELGRDFEHHVILVELGVDDGDFRLAERAV